MGGDCLKQLFRKLPKDTQETLIQNANLKSENIEDLVCRIPQDIYVVLINEIIDQFDEINNVDVKFFREFEKTDHGDLDVLYWDTDVNIIQLIKKIYNPIAIHKNGDVTSFSYKYSDTQYFQIDFIFVKNINMSHFFYSYGDIGMTLGIICNKYNLKLSIDGLYLKLTGNDANKLLNATYFHQNKNFEYLLSDDPIKICYYLGLDYNTWENGFVHMEESYEWLISSKFFKSEIITNNITKKFQTKCKRKYVAGFELFITNLNDDINNFNIECYMDFCEETLDYFNKLETTVTEITQQHKNDILVSQRREKFNGKDIVNKGVQGKDINGVKKYFSKYIKYKFNIKFEDWIDTNNRKTILNIFDEFYEIYQDEDNCPIGFIW